MQLIFPPAIFAAFPASTGTCARTERRHGQRPSVRRGRLAAVAVAVVVAVVVGAVTR